MATPKEFKATGRRKESVARVRIRKGTGQIIVNKRPLDVYFTRETAKMIIRQPLETIEQANAWDVHVNVVGGGTSGQAGAILHGIARALTLAEAGNRSPLKRAGYLRRDPRKVERKKYGQPGARKRFQYSKR
jgi:small subunit ribosomal protein S9